MLSFEAISRCTEVFTAPDIMQLTRIFLLKQKLNTIEVFNADFSDPYKDIPGVANLEATEDKKTIDAESFTIYFSWLLSQKVKHYLKMFE